MGQSKFAKYFLDQFEKNKQTTDYKVGDVLYEKDSTDPDNVLDVLYILEADYGDPLGESEEDYTSYYKFYSFNEGDIWENEPLNSGNIIYYERCT